MPKLWIFFLLFIFLNAVLLKESFTWFQQYIKTGVVNNNANFATFNNLCLTKDHSGYYSPAHLSWQNRTASMVAEYAHCRPNWVSSTQQNCSGSVPQPYEYGNYAKTDAHSISSDYYHNPVDYCKHNPHEFPCPNFWVKDNVKDINEFPTTNMRIPKLLEGVNPQVPADMGSLHTLSLTDVRDNERMTLLHPNKLDIALC